jgi:type I restriction enzyme S subunit
MVRDINESALPAGWRFVLLDDVTKRGSGHTPNKDHPEYWNGGVKWISLSDSSALDQGYIFKTDKEISAAGIKNSSAVVHPAETVVLSRDAGVGKSAVMKEPMAVSQHFIAWRCDNDKVLNSWFLYNWLQALKPEFERQAVGSTIKTIGLPYFKKLKIAIPPLPEQTKIAQILSTWDKAIATTEKLIGNSQQQKNVLVQQIITGKRRLFGFSSKWAYKKIGDFIVESRITGTTGDIAKKITIKLYGKGVISKVEKRLGSESTKYYSRKSGQFIYSKLDFLNGAFGIIPAELDGYESTLDLPAFDFKEGVCPAWFLYFVAREQFYSNNLGLANGGRKARRVNPSDLINITIKAPPFKEQQKIAAVLTAADNEIELLKKKLAFLKQEKAALMQQLLTGKRRVRVEAA